ncbi:NADH-quinone oxidoreductase subunit C [Cohnella pontilimi]|uniref:NADH-quinone oxidoreductase n=1 Tax=Cohnella pontilimi TaxID=2564100 RepID=A0A4U0FB45_9BACL|nr:NADH-quinone oxidoreductase subunit C [Cohnella pontilimi]TJY41901.1 NADH-quinone oxidoreductase subunit C [Cohnella pontilimi]
MSDEELKSGGEPGSASETQPEQPKPEAPAAAETPAAAAPPAPAAGEGEAPAPRRKETDEEKAARRKAALEAKEAAKAAAALAKAAAASGTAPAPAASGESPAAAGDAPAEPPAPPKPPSPNQPRLDRAVALLRELIAEDAVEEAYINEPNDHLPTLVLKNDCWKEAAALFRDHQELGCHYLRNVSGVDYETYMEVVYYPLNMERRETYCIKVRTDREQPSVPSVTPIWETANWNEREIFDLLGVDFPGHPDLRRIMMPDDWVGHPLRKDYVPLDPEV